MLSVAKRHGLIEALNPVFGGVRFSALSVAKRHGLIEAIVHSCLYRVAPHRYPWQNATASLKPEDAKGLRVEITPRYPWQNATASLKQISPIDFGIPMYGYPWQNATASLKR